MAKPSLAVFIALFSIVLIVGAAGAANAAEGSPCSSTAQCVSTVCLRNSVVFDSGDGASSRYSCAVDDAARPCTSFCGAATRKCLCGYSITGLCDQVPSFDSAGNLVSLGDASSVGEDVGACVINGKLGTVRQTFCPGCGNGLTYCKPNAPAPGKEETRTTEPVKTVTPTEQPEEPESTPAPSYQGYCGDRVCDQGEEAYCAIDCLSPYGPHCVLHAYPIHPPVGGSSEIEVRYENVLYPVYFATVNCGNGFVSYAWNCGGRSGECYARCRYAAQGVYTVTGFAGGVGCAPTRVFVGTQATPTPTATPTPKPTITPQPTPRYLNPRCAVETLPPVVYGSGVSNIKIPYYDVENAPTRATVICGNGEIVFGSCEGSAAQGNCVASCSYARPLRYPWAYSVDAVVSGVQCAAGTVSLLEGGATPTPTATATARPTGVLIVKVYREDGVRALWGAVVRVPGRGDFRTGFDGVIEVRELDAGDYALAVSADGYETQRVSARVRAGETTRVSVVMREASASPTPTTTAVPTPTATAIPYGSLTVKVTDCANGAAIAGARVELVQQSVPRPTPRGVYYTNAFGEAASRDLPSGDYAVGVSKEGYAAARASARVYGGQTASASVCLNAVAKARCAVSIAPSELKLGEAGVVRVDYFDLPAEPESVVVNCGNGATATAHCNGAGGSGTCAGGASCAYSAKGTFFLTATAGGAACETATAVASERGGDALYLQAVEAEKQATGGEKTCFALLLRNSGDASGVVELSVSASPSNNWKASFSPGRKFVVVPREIKNVDFCVEVPEAASATTVYAIAARSEINDAAASVTLRAYGSGDYSLEYPGCFNVEAGKGWVTRVLRVTNNALDGNYEVELDGGEIGVEADDVYAFKKGETRDVPLRFSTESLENKNYYFSFKLKRKLANGERAVVLQQTLCVRPSGAGTGAVTLSPNSLTVARGTTQTAVVRVRNTGSGSARYYVSALKKTGLTLAVSPQYATIDAGDEESVEVRVTADANAPLGPVSVPVRVYNSESGYYEGGYGYGDYSASIDCGDGETRVTQCGYGDGSCAASCVYDDAGTFAPRATYRGNSCAASSVRVLDYYPSNSLVLRAETPLIASSGSSVIRINYYSLSGGSSGGNAPVINNVEIDARADSADVYWTTDKGATSVVDYAYANHSNYRTVSKSGYDTSHVVTLTSLAPNTLYVFNVSSCDYEGRCTKDGEYALQTENATLGFAGANGKQRANRALSELSFDSTSRVVRVDCGNGQTQTVTCYDSTGSCTASCYYSSTGTYGVTASINGANPSVYGTRVVVARTDSQACFLTADPQTALDGESVNVRLNYYDIPSGGTQYGCEYYGTCGGGGLVDSQTLLVNVVAKTQGDDYENEKIIVDAGNFVAAPGAKTSVPATIRNKNYYDLNALAVSVDGLPNGVTAKTPAAFTLAAGSEKTIAIEFEVGDVPQGEYEVVLRASNADARSPAKRVKMRVRGAVGEARASLAGARTSVKRATEGANAGKYEISFVFTVKNDDEVVRTLSPGIEGLPAEWTYGLNPISATLDANETREFTATIYAPANAFDEFKEYPATLAVADETGKTKRIQIKINESGASVLSGFFTALGGDYGLLALFIILAAVGIALFYAAEARLKAAEKKKGEYGEDDKTGEKASEGKTKDKTKEDKEGGERQRKTKQKREK